MNLFRDTATLAVLILLALTVRVDLDGKPLEVDLASDAEAASVEEVSEQRPGALPAENATLAPPVWVVEPDGAPARGVRSELAEQVAEITLRRIGADVRLAEHAAARELVWKAGDKRLIVVVETDVAPVALPEPPAPAEPCGIHRGARLSC